MTEAPEKIWINFAENNVGRFIREWDVNPADDLPAEYVRADHVATLLAAEREAVLRKAADWCRTHTMEIPMDRSSRKFGIYTDGEAVGGGTHEGDGYAQAILALIDQPSTLDALIGAAYLDAASACNNEHLEGDTSSESDMAYTNAVSDCIFAVRSRTPADALAALDSVREAERETGFWAGRKCGGSKAEIYAALAAIRGETP